jgi:hypothetical protein
MFIQIKNKMKQIKLTKKKLEETKYDRIDKFFNNEKLLKEMKNCKWGILGYRSSDKIDYKMHALNTWDAFRPTEDDKLTEEIINDYVNSFNLWKDNNTSLLENLIEDVYLKFQYQDHGHTEKGVHICYIHLKFKEVK